MELELIYKIIELIAEKKASEKKTSGKKSNE